MEIRLSGIVVTLLILISVLSGIATVDRWNIEISLGIDGADINRTKEPATKFINELLLCFINGSNLDRLRYTWNTTTSKRRHYLRTSHEIQNVCVREMLNSKNVTDELKRCTSSETTYINFTSKVRSSNVCYPTNYLHGLTRDGIDIWFQCGGSDICTAKSCNTIAGQPSALGSGRETPSSDHSTITGIAAGLAAAIVAAATVAVLLLRKRHKARLTDSSSLPDNLFPGDSPSQGYPEKENGSKRKAFNPKTLHNY